MTDNISNRQGIQGYSHSTEGAFEGHAVMDHNAEFTSRANPLLARVATVTVGGTASDGDYVVTSTDEYGSSVSITFTRASSEANAAIAEALADAINASTAWRNIARAVYTSGATFDIEYLHTDRDYTEAATAPGSGTLASATSTAKGGVNIYAGRVVARHSSVAGACEPPDNISDPDALLGIAIRQHVKRNHGGVGLAAGEYYEPGDMVTVLRRGYIYVKNVSPSASGIDDNANGPRIVDATAGGQELGQLRGNADGSNTYTLDVSKARWHDVVPPGGIGRVWCNFS